MDYEYDPMDQPSTYTIDHKFLVASHKDGGVVESVLTDSPAEASDAFARMCDERKGNVVTIYDSRKLEYVARFNAGEKRHPLTRGLIELVLNPAGV